MTEFQGIKREQMTRQIEKNNENDILRCLMGERFHFQRGFIKLILCLGFQRIQMEI